MLLYAIVFISGGAILALELLASRIMTPYFGVSLYIWTGILSITLVSLAIGYHLGGRIASSRIGAGQRSRLLQLFALAPAFAAIAIVLACFVYPHTFAALASWSLIGGAFAACMVLLFLPLVATSAMNPLLVAIRLEQQGTRSGDAGAGRVFFVSTLGSVVGVLITAFALIPYITNFNAVLVVALVLALLPLAIAWHAPPSMSGKAGVVGTALAAAVLALGLLWQADAFTGRQGPYAYAGLTWRAEATYSSLFGTVKVLRSTAEPGTGRTLRVYFHDGLMQNSVDDQNRSASFYTYALEALARAYRPDMKSALVLGLGAGMVPMRLAARRVHVEVVDIDPLSPIVAERHFGFDPRAVRTHVADARTYLRQCNGVHDVVVVDLFHGDGTPDYLVTREFFADLRRCLTRDGIAVFNTFADLSRPDTYAHFLVTLRAELSQLALYRPRIPGVVHVNSFVVASSLPLAAPAAVTLDYVPPEHATALWDMLSAPTPITPRLLEGGRVVTDALNVAAHDLAAAQMIYRRSVVERMPRAMLMN